MIIMSCKSAGLQNSLMFTLSTFIYSYFNWIVAQDNPWFLTDFFIAALLLKKA